ncbi:DUF779 domain-containing protein [Flavihumibacter profundi]|nr:DUF779 domain-containing protein [Flavihumibacter profundi]
MDVAEPDVCLGQVMGCKFYMNADQFDYWGV